LSLPNDGVMQILMVDDATASREYANWKLIPLDNDRCHLINDNLDSELVLCIVDQ